MQKKIVGLKLIRNYPSAYHNLGDELKYGTKIQDTTIWFKKANVGGGIREDFAMIWPEFWEPIYEEEKIVDINRILNNAVIKSGGQMCPTMVRHAMTQAAYSTVELIADELYKYDVRIDYAEGEKPDWSGDKEKFIEFFKGKIK